MDKLRMQSCNGVEDNIMKIAQLFPDCVTETVDERSGQPKHLIDFEKLKQNLSDSVMSERAERYQFTWPDKSKAILLANSPINATLRPCREDSVDFDPEPLYRGRQPRCSQMSEGDLSPQGENDLYRPTLQHRKRFCL